MLSRKYRERLCHHCFPGLISFGRSNPLKVLVGRKIKYLRLFIPEKKILNLSSVDFFPEPITGRAGVSSSWSASYSDAARLLTGSPIHTKLEMNPKWFIILNKSQYVEHIKISSGIGNVSISSYGLCAEWQTSDDKEYLFDNLDPQMLLSRMEATLSLLRGEFNATLADEDFESAKWLNKAINYLSKCTNIIEDGADLNEFRDQRKRLIESYIDLWNRMGVPQRKSAVRIIPFLDGLWSRILLEDDNSEVELSRELCGLILGLELQQTRGIPTTRLSEFAHLMTDKSSLELFEGHINKAIHDLGEATENPIRIHKHGLKFRNLVAEEISFSDAMFDVSDVLQDLGYQTFLIGGTLLGAIREGRFIEYDDDVDIGFCCPTPSESLPKFLEQVAAQLNARGFSTTVVLNKLLFIRSPVTKRGIDAYPVVVRDKKIVRASMKSQVEIDLPYEMFFPLAQRDFYGRTVAVPRLAEEYLSAKFGPTWRTPDRYWGMGWVK